VLALALVIPSAPAIGQDETVHVPVGAEAIDNSIGPAAEIVPKCVIVPPEVLPAAIP